MTKNTAIEKTERQYVQVKSRQAPSNSWSYRPNVDIFETPEELLLVADLPGAGQDQVHVDVDAGILTIQGHVTPTPRSERRSLLQEYGVGNFHRRFEIDNSIDTEGISTDYRHGTLTVHLPFSPLPGTSGAKPGAAAGARGKMHA